MAKLSKSEVEMLIGHARRQEKVAIEVAKQQSAARKAEFEARLATEFDARDEDWRDIVDEAKRAVARANAHIADVCRRRGFPESWAPAPTRTSPTSAGGAASPKAGRPKSRSAGCGARKRP